jgi:calcineurin-like phosphoesterase family protein
MSLKISSEKKVWITSDTHFNHKNICRGVTDWRLEDGSIPEDQTRDFDTLNQMNDAIVNNINAVVGQDDVLIHLGDWSFGGFENIQKLRDRIICKEIHLLFGNHDHHIERNRANCQSMFTSAQHFLQIEYMGQTIESMHYPISSWNGLRKGRIHLHGHCHLSNEHKFGNGRRMDVGMDGHLEFRPYDLHREVITPMLKRPIGSELGHLDHHVDDIKGIVG